MEEEKSDGGDCDEQGKRAHGDPAKRGLFSFRCSCCSCCSRSSTRGFQLFWYCRISEFLSVEIRDGNANTVFDFALSQFIKKWPPFVIFFQILGHMFRKKNVARVAAIHDALRRV